MKINNKKWVTVKNEDGEVYTIRIDSIVYLDHSDHIIRLSNKDYRGLGEDEFEKLLAHLNEVSQ